MKHIYNDCALILIRGCLLFYVAAFWPKCSFLRFGLSDDSGRAKRNDIIGNTVGVSRCGAGLQCIFLGPPLIWA